MFVSTKNGDPTNSIKSRGWYKNNGLRSYCLISPFLLHIHAMQLDPRSSDNLNPIYIIIPTYYSHTEIASFTSKGSFLQFMTE